MTRNLAATDHSDLPLDISEQAYAANAALFAAKEQATIARQSWATVKAVFGDTRKPMVEALPSEQVARRFAVRLDQAARAMFGIVSSSAAGLVGVTEHGALAVIEDTTGGSDYFDGVRYYNEKGEVGLKEWDVPVSGFVAFFDSFEAAHEWLHPKPRRFGH